MSQQTTEPDWIELARQSIEAQQSEEVRRQIDTFYQLIESRKAVEKIHREAMQRGVNGKK